MKVTVQFFAGFRELTGTDGVEIEIPEGTTGDILSRRLAEQFPGIEKLIPSTRLAVNLEFKPDETVLTDGDEVAFIPPVSGG